MIAITNAIPNSWYKKMFKQSQWLPILANLEYQVVKVYEYLRHASGGQMLYPHNPLVYCAFVDLPEGLATNMVYIMEQAVSGDKINTSSIIRSFKTYCSMNVVTIIYYEFYQQGDNTILSLTGSDEKFARALIYSIIMFVTLDKLHGQFGEPTISEKINELKIKVSSK